MKLGRQVREWVTAQLPLLAEQAHARSGQARFVTERAGMTLEFSRFGVPVVLSVHLGIVVGSDGEIVERGFQIERDNGRRRGIQVDLGTSEQAFIQHTVRTANEVVESIDAAPHMKAAAEAWRLKRSVKSVPGLSKKPKRI